MNTQSKSGLLSTIRCELCGLECSMQISHTHLRAAHNMTTAQYRALGYQTLSPARLEQLKASPVAQGQHRHLRGTDHPNFKGGHVTGIGYRIVSVNGKHQYEHRVIVEQMLGRSLKSHEVVHHIDGNGLNNSPDNLQVMDRSAHSRLDANPRQFWNITPDTFEAARTLRKMGWSIRKIQRALRTNWHYVKSWVDMPEDEVEAFAKMLRDQSN